MSYQTFNKEIRRAITGSWGRFIAIFAIVALGVGFYAGLRMTPHDMNSSADAFYDGTGLMDIRVVSTMGMDPEDLDAIRDIEGVENVMGAYETDVIADIDDEPYSVRVHSLPESAIKSETQDEVTVLSDDPDYLNRLILAEGRWPQAEGECIMSYDRVMNSPLNIGDKVALEEGLTPLEDVLKTKNYTVVGLAHSSYYASQASMGITSLGSGLVQQFMYVPASDFADDYPYTEAYVTVEGARDLDSSTDQYDSVVSKVVERIEAIAASREDARYEKLRSEAQDELDEAKSDYESEKADAEGELADARKKLDDAAEELQSGHDKLNDSIKQYNDGVAELAKQRSDAEKKLDDAAKKIDEAQAKLDASKKELEKQEKELAASMAQVEQEAEKLPTLKQQLSQLEAALAMAQTPEQKEALGAQIAQVQAGITMIEEGQKQIAYAEKQIADGKAKIKSGQSEIDASRSKLASETKKANEGIASAQGKLDDAKSQIESGKSELENGAADYKSGMTEYSDAEAEANEKFADAERELDDAQQEIDDIEHPEWLVMDRSKNYGAESFKADAGRIDNIAQVFPLIFFLVAALVALTSMTRMVDEERMLIGTYKALGYSRSRISSKYLIYALIASLGGSVVGIAILSIVLPVIIMKAYSIVYIVPPTVMEIDWPIALLATALGVGITLVATWGAAISTLRESPAALMLPKAPKAGKRILLERIRPLWRHLSFLWKVTCRNIFRYKKRMIMTVIGIAGCTALLLTGFGLQNSINDIIDIQYGEIVHYNTTVTMEDDATQDDGDDLQALLAADGDVQKSANVMQKSMAAVGESRDFTSSIVVPESIDEFKQLHTLRERIGHEKLELADDGAIITEKLGTLLGIGIGDTVTLAETDDMGNATNDRYDFTVTGLAEGYIGNTVFITENGYISAFGTDDPVEYSTLFIDSAADEQTRSELAKGARAIEGVKTLAYNDETIQTYRKQLNSVNMVVYVLIIAAALLAFIVLYNLTNINITERIREIATLKVLGFTQREIQHYIFREIIILAIIGAVAGLVLGIWLENFVVVTAEVDAVMFGRVIHWDSFLYSFALTMLFTVIVTLFMRGKLNKVDMVESLKSNE